MALEIRVLVVEDDPETRMLTEALLSGRKGVCLCALAKDGLEGLELVEQTRPDIVLLDLILPGMDGLDFLRTLRRRNERPAVVVASQASEPTVIRLAFQLGASYYLIKPLNFDSLPDLFHSLCLEPRERAAADFAREHGVYLVLKGPGTIAAAPDGRCMRNPTGNCGMAKGGSGDVLAGMLVSLLGLGLPPMDACCAAVWLHGRAGDLAAREVGLWGMTPSDLLDRIPAALREVTE